MANTAALSPKLTHRLSTHGFLASAFVTGFFLTPTREHPRRAPFVISAHRRPPHAHFTLSLVFDTLGSSVGCTNPLTCVELVPSFLACREYQQNIVL